MDKKINVIRSQGNKLLTDDYLALSTLLIKAGYTVRIATREVPGKKTKEKGGQYYVHPWGCPHSAIKGSYGDKKKALKLAAKMCGITVKEYISIRKQEDK